MAGPDGALTMPRPAIVSAGGSTEGSIATDLPHRDLVRLRALAAAADAAGLLHPVQQALIHRRGWLRMLAPEVSGGTEWPLPRVVRLEEAIAAADGSCGWVVTLCAGAGWFAGFLPPALARQIVGTRRVCLAGSGAPTGVAERDGAGWRLSGRWAHASGAPMATHFTLNAVLTEGGQPLPDAAGSPRIRAFVVPAARVRIEPTWHGIGLRATASHAFHVDDVRVPAEQGFDIDPAAATAGGPLYRFPFMALAYVTLAATLAGMARHFIDLARPTIARRTRLSGGVALVDVPAVRQAVQQADDDVAAARTGFYRLLDRAWQQVAAGDAVGPGDAAALQRASLALVEAARRAVDGLYPYCGLHAADARSEINRVWRDVHTATQHALWLP